MHHLPRSRTPARCRQLRELDLLSISASRRKWAVGRSSESVKAEITWVACPCGKEEVGVTGTRETSSEKRPPPSPSPLLLPRPKPNFISHNTQQRKFWKTSYPGVITSVNNDGTFDITFDDGDKRTGVRSSSMRATAAATSRGAPMAFAVGDNVTAKIGNWKKQSVASCSHRS